MSTVSVSAVSCNSFVLVQSLKTLTEKFKCLTLCAVDALHCMTAVKQLDTLRVQLRSTMMSRLTELATPPPASIPQSPLTTANNFIHGSPQVPPRRLSKLSTQAQGDTKQTLSTKAPTKEELLKKREPSMIPRAETSPLDRVTSAPP